MNTTNNDSATKLSRFNRALRSRPAPYVIVVAAGFAPWVCDRAIDALNLTDASEENTWLIRLCIFLLTLLAGYALRERAMYHDVILSGVERISERLKSDRGDIARS